MSLGKILILGVIMYFIYTSFGGDPSGKSLLGFGLVGLVLLFLFYLVFMAVATIALPIISGLKKFWKKYPEEDNGNNTKDVTKDKTRE